MYVSTDYNTDLIAENNEKRIFELKGKNKVRKDYQFDSSFCMY